MNACELAKTLGDMNMSRLAFEWLERKSRHTLAPEVFLAKTLQFIYYFGKHQPIILLEIRCKMAFFAFSFLFSKLCEDGNNRKLNTLCHIKTHSENFIFQEFFLAHQSKDL